MRKSSERQRSSWEFPARLYNVGPHEIVLFRSAIYYYRRFADRNGLGADRLKEYILALTQERILLYFK